MPRNILITGGAGYIGSALATSLVGDTSHIVVVDDVSTGQPELLPKEVQFIKGDITNLDALRKVCQNQPFDIIIHCAAKKAVGESEENPSKYFLNNVVGSLNVLRVMEEFAIPEIIFSSTAAVYGLDETTNAMTEDSPIAPANIYGLSKRMVEEMIISYVRLEKIKKYTIFRYFNVAGDIGLRFKENNAQNVFPKIAKAKHMNKEFLIFGDDYQTPDGTGVRDYIHLSDLVEAHHLALARSEGGIFNLGTGQGYSVKELLDTFAEVYEEKVLAKVVERRAGDPAILVANADKAREILGWKPKQDLKAMVESTIEAYL